MTWTKLKTSVVASAVIVAAGAPAVVQQGTIHDLRRENLALAIQAEQTVATPSGSGENDRLRQELERQKKLAAEVLELRARLAKLQRTRDTDTQLLADLKQENDKLNRTLAAIPEKQEELSYDKARAMEDASHARRVNKMKKLGLAYRIWLNENNNAVPETLESLASVSDLFKRTLLNQLSGQYQFFPHPKRPSQRRIRPPPRHLGGTASHPHSRQQETLTLHIARWLRSNVRHSDHRKRIGETSV